MRTDNNKKNSRRTGLIILLALVLILAIGIIAFFSIKNYDKPLDASSTKTIDFVVPSGASTTKIANLLESNGLIKNATIFKLKTKLNGLDGKYQAGEYELGSYMSMSEIMTAIQNGKRETRKITIKEGWTIKEIAEYLEAESVCTAAEFYDALENEEFDQWFVSELEETAEAPNGVSKKANKFEGFLFPDTYEIYVGCSARSVINKMLNQFASVYTEEYKTRAQSLGWTLQQAVTIASLIEEETVLDSERKLVSSVIYNRLSGNATAGKLQFCSTVLYSLGYHKDRVLYKDLEIDSPYNTYMYKGLPIGPICSPGKACLEAALYPDDTNYLYFVVSAKGDGSHNFSSNGNDHSAYKEEYLKTISK